MPDLTTSSYRIVDAFDTSYWSGVDVSIYLDTLNGKILLDEAVQLSYSIQEQVIPYYAYNSHTFNTVQHGTRLINGELTVNFKHSGYIFSLLNNVNKLPSATKNDIVDQAKSWNSSLTKPASNTILNSLHTTVSSLSNPDVARAFVENYKAKYTPVNEYNVYKNLTTSPSSTKGMFETGLFNLDIVFGTMYQESLKMHLKDGTDEFFTDGLVLSDPDNLGKPILMGRKLIDVHIMTMAKTMADDGRPYMETYSFMAKDVRTISTNDFQGNN